MVLFLGIACRSSGLFGQQPADSGASQTPADAMLAIVRARTQQNPGHSDSWRLLGKVEAKAGNSEAAINAYSQSLRIDPENAASHFDICQLLHAIGDPAAPYHAQQCVLLAPASDYAEQLHAGGFAQRPPSASPSGQVHPAGNRGSAPAEFASNKTSIESGAAAVDVEPVSYQIQTFDGEEELDRRLEQVRSDISPTPKRLRVLLELGVLYNTNVSLTPVSRELASNSAESFQGFINPELEWIAIRRDSWRAGPLARGYFTVNEAHQSDLDLTSGQPGAFIERDFCWGENDLIARLDYVYALDLLGGEHVDDRHSVTASVIMIRPDLDVFYAYLATGVSQFKDDGINPSATSLDGAAISGGLSRFSQTGIDWLPTWSSGIDLEYANTEGDDYRYSAINGHSDATFQFGRRLSFIPSVGIGYRNYADFTGTPDRDELTWRAGGKLRWMFSDLVALSLVGGHDRFASDNQDFDAKRTQAGLVLGITY
ncbi:hypothetical protein [Rosistilla carotiformis]|nr:hypothetical protein [Rosistilla carotiformis]